MGRLAGKRAIITGGGAGMGASGARLFAREGAAVACLDIQAAAAESVAAAIRDEGGTAFAFSCDVADEDSLAQAIAAAAEAMGGIDICWVNAGIAGEGKAAELERAVWDRAIAVNLTGSWLTSKYVLPHLVASGAGSLIFTASTCGFRGPPNVAAMSATKAGVMGLARQIAMEYAPDNVRSNVIMPGSTLTETFLGSYDTRAEMLGTTRELLMQKTLENFPLMRFGQPEDMANLALFLASDESGWMTGHWLPVDGGRFARF
jgi:NAD(P)-dependent dehydrogenase (short-subunit alcohol dehydrogenase family)